MNYLRITDFKKKEYPAQLPWNEMGLNFIKAYKEQASHLVAYFHHFGSSTSMIGYTGHYSKKYAQIYKDFYFY